MSLAFGRLISLLNIYLLFLTVLDLHWCLGFSPVAASGDYSLFAMRGASHCSGFSCWGAPALGHTGLSS